MWKKRVVVIDDDLICRNLFRDILSYIGMDVVVLPSAQGAFERIQDTRPDIVICDMIFNNKPEGARLIEQLRRERSTRSIPIILCSAALELTRIFMPTLESLGVMLLPKPFDLDALYIQLDDTLALGLRDTGFVLSPV